MGEYTVSARVGLEKSSRATTLRQNLIYHYDWDLIPSTIPRSFIYFILRATNDFFLLFPIHSSSRLEGRL